MRQEREIRKLSLTDLLAKPFQRIPRYRLLLQVRLSTKQMSIYYLDMIAPGWIIKYCKINY